ncbi:hypothetical protein KC19_2G262600 [Ceratodon purpureus]|uniref:Chromo domain-containing protein n=1 Tax=Ceratodon purpureus TaxID=3225 RepID=A0A8T0J0Z8_CERPU|nr:hypothetical protein KC19_2G262600 [Ceratodon purpureus]
MSQSTPSDCSCWGVVLPWMRKGKSWENLVCPQGLLRCQDDRSSDATGSGNLHGDQHNSEDEAQNDVPLGARFGSSSQHPEGAVNETGLVSGSCANVVNTNLKDGSVEYLVQWKSRSHAHDKWVNEKELEKLAPKELARFKKLLHEGQLYHAQEKYDAEWTEPERIIQKRLTRVTRRRPDSPVEKGKISNIQNAEIEWFVKWKGLGYEHCTWEPANAGVLASSRGIELINESEGWKNAAMQRARKESQEERFEKRVKLPPWYCGVYGGGFGGVVSWESVVMWEFAFGCWNFSFWFWRWFCLCLCFLFQSASDRVCVYCVHG